jgi:hypothetical protein
MFIVAAEAIVTGGASFNAPPSVPPAIGRNACVMATVVEDVTTAANKLDAGISPCTTAVPLSLVTLSGVDGFMPLMTIVAAAVLGFVELKNWKVSPTGRLVTAGVRLTVRAFALPPATPPQVVEES